MRTVFGMIVGAILLALCVYAYDSYQTSSVAHGDMAQTKQTIVNWDVVADDWRVLKARAHEDWTRISSR